MWVLLICFLIGMGLPFIFLPCKKRWLKWIPTIILLIISISIFVKLQTSPDSGWDGLTEFVYLIIFILGTIGSLLGVGIVTTIQNKEWK